MTYNIVESAMWDSDGKKKPTETINYFDGRSAKHVHNDARMAARDFGERVSMLDGTKHASSRIEHWADGVTFHADYLDGTVIEISLK